MSGGSARRVWPAVAPDRDRVARVGRTLTRVLFGGRPGLALFCASLALFVLTWRIGVFFNDIGLYPTMLEYLSRGQLSFGSPDQFEFAYPGMHHRNGEVYGRAFGLVVPALPVLWVLEGLDAVVDLRWLVVLGWSGLLLATGFLAGDCLGQRRRGLLAGGALAGGALLGNAWFYKPFVADLDTVALQLVTMVAGAVTVVAVYRLLAERHGERVGLLGGAAVLLGTPVAVWATTPKRHALAAMFVVLALYAFARSRADDPTPERRALYRGGAYACAGLLAWVHAPEGFTLFAALAVVDLPTARRNDARTLATVAAVFALSLVPFLVTNTLVSGNPVLPPHFLDGWYGQSLTEAASGGTAGDATSAAGGGTAGSGGGGDTASSGSWLAGVTGTVLALGAAAITKADPALALVERGVDMYVSGSVVLATEPDRVFRTFVRWGGSTNTDAMTLFFDGGTNLSVLESAPVLAGLAALPLRRRVATLRSDDRHLRDLADPVDLVAVVFALLLVCLYMNNLPVHIMVTVRYLHPLYPVAVYGLFRLPAVRAAVTTHTRSTLLGYEAAVLFGLVLSGGAMLLFETTKGQMVQHLGLAALAVAGVLAVALLASHHDERAERVAAAAFGAAVGVATVYLLVTAFVLFHYGPSALPAVDVLTGEFRWLTITTGS